MTYSDNTLNEYPCYDWNCEWCRMLEQYGQREIDDEVVGDEESIAAEFPLLYLIRYLVQQGRIRYTTPTGPVNRAHPSLTQLSHPTPS